ncbi:MAG: hypothetical protein LUH57_00480 [Ruminococcus sp.]|nr:hypothetical protein [Ruminococcus sp.]
MNKLYEKYFRDKRNCDILYIIGFVGILLLFIYKAPLEIQGQDEAFYLTIPKRLSDGDIFIFDEWHGSQLSALILYPIMALHNLFFSNEGIVLHFRYIYIFFQAFCAAVIYIRLRSYKLFGAIASLLFFLFTPYDILALSYNTMGIMLMTLSGVIAATAKSKKAYFVSGLLFAGAVLCCPYLLAAYIIFTLATIIVAVVKKDKKIVLSWLFFTLGSALLAIVLAVFVLSRASFSDVMAALPNIFDDPEHVSKSLFSGIRGYFKAIRTAFQWGVLYIVVYLIDIVLIIIDKRRYEHRIAYLTVSVVIAICMLAEFAFYLDTKTYNYIMFPLMPVGLVAFLVTKNKNWRVFTHLLVGGFLYTVCVYFSSNQAFYIISAMSVVADVGAVILIHDALLEEKYRKVPSGEKTNFTVGYVIVLAVLLIQFPLMTYTKATHKFWSHVENSQLTVEISEGVYKGIKVTPTTKTEYITALSALKTIDADEGDRILYASDTVWYYLQTDELKIGAYSAWLSGENITTINRLDKYYTLNPENIPDIIYVDLTNDWPQAAFSEFLSKYGFTLVSAGGANIYSRG